MGNERDLLGDGEKYALVALQTRVKLPSLLHAPGPPALWASSVTPVQLDDDWERWLGSIRADHLRHANLFLIAKASSQTLDILDEENTELERQVYWFHTGLLLSARLTTFEDPMILTGARNHGHTSVRQLGHASRAAPILGLPPQPITPDCLTKAATIAASLWAWSEAGGSWRFNRVLQIYAGARANPDPLERIHQFSRSIEGLILPDAGKTKRQFISRTETFIGPRQHALMGEIYDVRSAVEHLREYELLEPPDRASREDLVRKAALMEYLSRHCISRVLLTKSLWPHFSNPAALEGFWKLPSGERKALWGCPIDLMHNLAEYHPQFIRDEDLGLK